MPTAHCRCPWAAWCLQPVLLLVVLTTAVQGLSVDIEGGSGECFVLQVEEGVNVGGNFEVLTDGDLQPVRVTVMNTDPEHSDLLYEAIGLPEGSFSFEAKLAGEYQMCIENGREEEDDGLLRAFGFAFRTEGLNPEEHPDVADNKQGEKLQQLVLAAEELMEGLNTMVDHQSYMRLREEAHRRTTDSTNSRVLWWNVFEAMILLGMAYGQIHYIRQFFETKRVV